MKLLLLINFIFITSIYAKNDDKPEIISDEEIQKKFISVVKDNEIEKKLEQSAEFQKCAQDAKFDKNQGTRDANAAKAEKCFQDALSKQPPEKIQQLAKQFELENHGLVNSKNTKDITDYFTDKIYKAMTGIDRKAQKENEIYTLKKSKLVSQGDFLKIYKNHVAKSTMFEISRFCFENLRLKGAPTTSFADHWGSHLDQSPISISIDQLSDDGTQGFGIDENNVKDAKASYDGMFKGITGSTQLASKNLGDYFGFCAKMMIQLCDQFKKDQSKPGSNACLAQDRVQKAKKAFSDATKVDEFFDKEYTGGTGLNLDKGQKLDFYKSDGDSSHANIAEITSYDILEGGKQENDERNQLAEKCIKSPGDKECDKFFTQDDSRLKVEFNTDISERLKKEAELAIIRGLKDEKKLKDYLQEKGYLDLLSKLEAGTLKKDDIETELGKFFDAKRAATLKSIQDKIGKRQMTDDEVKDQTKRDANVSETAKEILTERARMSQVVLFNNIILGYAQLVDQSGKKSSRYVNAWRREEKSLESDAQGKVDESLFDGFKQTISGDKNASAGDESVDIDSFLDSIFDRKQKSN